jgi:hypothetical protein
MDTGMLFHQINVESTGRGFSCVDYGNNFTLISSVELRYWLEEYGLMFLGLTVLPACCISTMAGKPLFLSTIFNENVMKMP